MLIVKEDKTRTLEEGQIFVELTKNRDLSVTDCDRLGYWCDKAHLRHFILEINKVMENMKIIIPHEGVNEIPKGFKPLMTDEGKLVSIIPEGMHREDAYWIKTEKIIPVVDWEQRRYELAKAAMQGFCANSHDSIAIATDAKTVSEWSVGFANAMIEKLKGD